MSLDLFSKCLAGIIPESLYDPIKEGYCVLKTHITSLFISE